MQHEIPVYADMIGQSALHRRLQTSLVSGRIVHAMLFLGQKGSGKRSVASVYARSLLCLQAQDGIPCEQCVACKLTHSGNHADLYRIAPQPGRARIDVDSVRALLEELQIKPYHATRRVVMIEDAHLMTQQAQNALLKTLESPTPGCTFLLLAETLAPILPTVLSRCVLLQMPTLSVAQRTQALLVKGIEPKTAQECAAAQPTVGQALTLANDTDALLARREALALLQQCLQPNHLPECFAALGKLRGMFSAVLDTWADVLGAALRATQGVAAPAPAFLQDCKAEALAEMLQACIQAREELYQSVIHTLVADHLLLALQNAVNSHFGFSK